MPSTGQCLIGIKNAQKTSTNAYQRWPINNDAVGSYSMKIAPCGDTNEKERNLINPSYTKKEFFEIAGRSFTWSDEMTCRMIRGNIFEYFSCPQCLIAELNYSLRSEILINDDSQKYFSTSMKWQNTRNSKDLSSSSKITENYFKWRSLINSCKMTYTTRLFKKHLWQLNTTLPRRYARPLALTPM